MINLHKIVNEYVDTVHANCTQGLERVLGVASLAAEELEATDKERTEGLIEFAEEAQYIMQEFFNDLQVIFRMIYTLRIIQAISEYPGKFNPEYLDNLTAKLAITRGLEANDIFEDIIKCIEAVRNASHEDVIEYHYRAQQAADKAIISVEAEKINDPAYSKDWTDQFLEILEREI